MKKIIVIVLCSFGLLTANDAVLATVGGEKITDADVAARINSLPAQYASYYSSDEGKTKMLEQMIDEKLIYLQAKAKGFENNAEVKDAVEKLKKEVMTNYYLKDDLSKLTATDKEIDDYYEANKTKFITPEKIRASHILVKTEAEANAILAELNKGKDFAALAKAKSTCPSSQKGGDLDFFSRGQMVKPFEDAAFALKKGDYTKKPVQTQFGWHIIKLTDQQNATQQNLDDLRGDIRSELLQQKQKARIEELLAEARKANTVSR